MVNKRIWLAAALGMSACVDQPLPMEPAQLLARASLDLRGVRPSVEELEAVEADPSLVDSFIDEYMQDERFGERVISMFSDIYRTRIDRYGPRPEDFNLSEEFADQYDTSIGEEGLRRLAFIAQNDLPYSEISTADWTMANEVLGAIWPVDYPAGATGWLQVRYTDGRPTAGLLSDNGFWWRYGSTFVNSNRGRANAISRVLLGEDYLAKPIRFERNVSLLDDDAIRNAIKLNPGCNACHSTLDPLAANLWGFFYNDPDSPVEARTYHFEKERFFEFTNETNPAYYGLPLLDLSDLGRKVAQDPRLVETVTRQIFEILLARASNFDDTASLTQHREVFVDNGIVLRDLFRSVMTSPEYRMDNADDPRFTTRKQVSVDILNEQVADLTGFRFLLDGKDTLKVGSGLRGLAGGADGIVVTVPSREPTVTSALVVERLAEAASDFVVDQDASGLVEKKLFTEIDFTETPDSNREAMVRQLEALHVKLFSTRATPEEIDADLALWSEIFALGNDSKLAWKGLLSALFRDPEFILY
jgi:Protein of unknown function (DUF1549)